MQQRAHPQDCCLFQGCARCPRFSPESTHCTGSCWAVHHQGSRGLWEQLPHRAGRVPSAPPCAPRSAQSLLGWSRPYKPRGPSPPFLCCPLPGPCPEVCLQCPQLQWPSLQTTPCSVAPGGPALALSRLLWLRPFPGFRGRWSVTQVRREAQNPRRAWAQGTAGRAPSFMDTPTPGPLLHPCWSLLEEGQAQVSSRNEAVTMPPGHSRQTCQKSIP